MSELNSILGNPVGVFVGVEKTSHLVSEVTGVKTVPCYKCSFLRTENSETLQRVSTGAREGHI